MEIFNDFNTSVEKALSEIDPKWREYEGLIVCGTHSPHNVEEMLTKIKEYREGMIPTLGICFGAQLMVIDHAKREENMPNATSEEFGKGKTVVFKLPKLEVGIRSVKWADRHETKESFWHNYGWGIKKDSFELATSYEECEQLMDFIHYVDSDLAGESHPFWLGVQFHPEYQSSKESPHPVLVEFLNHAKEYTRKMAM